MKYRRYFGISDIDTWSSVQVLRCNPNINYWPASDADCTILLFKSKHAATKYIQRYLNPANLRIVEFELNSEQVHRCKQHPHYHYLFPIYTVRRPIPLTCFRKAFQV